jgi:hypothetical protein
VCVCVCVCVCDGMVILSFNQDGTFVGNDVKHTRHQWAMNAAMQRNAKTFLLIEAMVHRADSAKSKAT